MRSIGRGARAFSRTDRLRRSSLACVIAVAAALCAMAMAEQEVHGAPAPVPRSDDALLAGSGPFEVARERYSLGATAFRSDGLQETPNYTGPGDAKAEITGEVHFPAGLPGGRHPFVLMLPGFHSPCYAHLNQWRVGFDWPCTGQFRSLPSYQGFGYAAADLASHGFVVVSISANGVGVFTENFRDLGAGQRVKLIAKHLELWRRWNRGDGNRFGGRFRRAIDFSRLGLMGHSRGGEGVITFARRDQASEDAYGIDAVLALAPTYATESTLTRTPLAVVIPYCDGDVYTLDGVRAFDDAAHARARDRAPKHLVTVLGVNHNFFNTVWTPSGGFPVIGSDSDAVDPCVGEMTETEQPQVGAQLITSYFRRYLAKERAATTMWTGASEFTGLPGVPPIVDYQAPTNRRLAVDSFATAKSLTRGDTGSAVTTTGLSRYSWCSNRKKRSCIPGPLGGNHPRDAHYPGQPQAIIGWSSPGAKVRFELPTDDRDLGRFSAFRARIAPNPGYQETRANLDQAVSVRLTDGRGVSAEVALNGPGEPALSVPPGLLRELAPGELTTTGASPTAPGRMILHQIRVDLSRFQGPNLTDVRSVELVFNSPAGVVSLADVTFTAA